MPWNDLYSTARRVAPGVTYPPAVIGLFGKLRTMFMWAACHEKERKYVSCNLFGVLGYLWRLYRHETRRGGILIIHIHNPVLSLVGLVAKLIFPRIKIVGNLHTDWCFLKIWHKDIRARRNGALLQSLQLKDSRLLNSRLYGAA